MPTKINLIDYSLNYQIENIDKALIVKTKNRY